MTLISYIYNTFTSMGFLEIVSRGDSLIGVNFLEPDAKPSISQPDDAVIEQTCRQLASYFERRRTEFELTLDIASGSPFQRAVWKALLDVPYGETISYAELARRVGKPGSARAVGAAVGTNPIPIIIPCHRIIGSNGSLTGFGGGLPRKRWLLEIENASFKEKDPRSKLRGRRTLPLFS